jgi:hypothetical protein
MTELGLVVGVTVPLQRRADAASTRLRAIAARQTRSIAYGEAFE